MGNQCFPRNCDILFYFGGYGMRRSKIETSNESVCISSVMIRIVIVCVCKLGFGKSYMTYACLQKILSFFSRKYALFGSQISEFLMCVVHIHIIRSANKRSSVLWHVSYQIHLSNVTINL